MSTGLVEIAEGECSLTAEVVGLYVIPVALEDVAESLQGRCVATGEQLRPPQSSGSRAWLRAVAEGRR